MLTRLLDFFRGGSRDFNEAEKRLLSALADALPEHEKEILLRQLSSVRLVQRQHPGRLVVAYYRNPQEVPQLPYRGIEYCIAKINYRTTGKTKATYLVLHHGRFMSFERNVPRTIADIESLGKVVLHPPTYKRVAQEIDAEEHDQSA